jgi:hypothetical protein
MNAYYGQNDPYYNPTTVDQYLQPQAPAVDNGPAGPNTPWGGVTNAGPSLPPGGQPAPYAPPQIGYSGAYVPGSNPAYDALLREQQAQQASLTARGGVITAGQAYANARGGVATAEGNVIPFQQATVDANRNAIMARLYGLLPAQQSALGAQQGVLGAQAQQTAAERGVLGAQSAYNTGERSFITAQQGENTQQQAEFQREQAALHNVGDQAAAAQASRFQTARDRQNATYGIAPAADVIREPGDNTPLPPGTRQKIESQADIYQRQDQAAQAGRAFQLKAAQLVVSLLDNDKAKAEEVATAAGLSVQDAQQLASQAQLGVQQQQLNVSGAEAQSSLASNAQQGAEVGVSQANVGLLQARAGLENATYGSDQANLDVSQAQLGRTEADTPPAPGLVHGIDTSSGLPSSDWLTPAEADLQRTQYEQNLQTGRTAVTTGGDAFSGIPNSVLLNQYQFPGEQTNPNIAPHVSIGNDQIEATITRNLQRTQGLSPAQAKAAFDALVAQERAQRLQQQYNSNSGRPSQR